MWEIRRLLEKLVSLVNRSNLSEEEIVDILMEEIKAKNNKEITITLEDHEIVTKDGKLDIFGGIYVENGTITAWGFTQ